MSKRRRTGITMNKKLGSTLIAMTIIIFMLFLTLGMFTKNFFGKSASAEIASAQASIVEGKLSNVNADETIDTDSQGEYTFSVKNTDNDGNKVSEVAMRYKLSIETDAENYDKDNVDYILCRVNDDKTETEISTTKIENSVEWYTDEDGDDTMKFEVKKDQSGNLESQVHNYKLNFIPHEGDATLKFKVKISAQQID